MATTLSGTAAERTMSTVSGHGVEGAASAHRGDDDILQDAIAEHWAGVCRLLCSFVGDPDDAQDLALDVFCRLHTSPPQDPTKIRSWLYRVASNVGLNALRARKRRRRYEEAAGRFQLQRTTGLDPSVEVQRRDARAQVRAVLVRMGPRRARLLLLRYAGLSYAELADALGVAPGSVGTLLARAEKEFERRYRAMEADHATHT
jgi:RNA polymerase sigma-70 factor (ECF subfamily)